MISPYELAFLCDHAYRSDPQILPSSYAINIEGAAQWGVGAHDGVSDSFFCTKYIKTGTFENVIAFRGTGGRVADIAVDASQVLLVIMVGMGAEQSDQATIKPHASSWPLSVPASDVQFVLIFHIRKVILTTYMCVV